MRTFPLIIKLLAALIAAAALPSCAMIPGYSEPSDQKILSAIGFDADSGGITVLLKTVATEKSEAELISGKGATIEIAISSALADQKSPPEVSHCALAVLGEGIDDAWVSKILDYFSRNSSLTAAAYFVSASNAEKLLSIEGISGYDLARAIGEVGENPGMDTESRYYRITAARLEEGRIFALPYFYSDGERAEIYGMTVYMNDRPTLTLTRAESGYYMMIRGLFKSSLILGDSAGISGSIGVAHCRTEYEFSKGELKIICRITPDRDLGGGEHADELCAHTEKRLYELYEYLSGHYGDIFKLSRIAARRGVIFDLSTKVTIECVTEEGQ